MMEFVKLKKVCKIGNGFAFKSETYQDSGIPLLRISNIINGTISFKEDSICVDENFLKTKTDFIVQKGDVVIALSGATTGKFGVYNLEHPSLLNQRIGIIKFNNSNNLDSRYFYFYLNILQSQILNKAGGAAQPNISTKEIGEFQIPLPPLREQKRIADLLDAADKLRQKDKVLLEKYDQLAQSLFLEMFGDPVKNEKGWEVKKLKEIANVITGQTPPSSLDNMFGGEIPFVTPGDLESDREVKRTLTFDGAKKSRMLREGGLFVCCIGATIGKMNLAKKESAFNQQINGVDWNNEINDLFGYFATKAIKNDIIENSISTTLPILKKSEFEKLKIIVPEISLQNQFAEQVQLIERQKELVKKNLEKSEELFGALMGEVFG